MKLTAVQRQRLTDLAKAEDEGSPRLVTYSKTVEALESAGLVRVGKLTDGPYVHIVTPAGREVLK